MREQHYPSGARHMPLENDFTRVFGAIKELEARVERMEQSVWSGGETIAKFDWRDTKIPADRYYDPDGTLVGVESGTVGTEPEWKPWEPDYKALFESERLGVKRLQRELSSEVIKREELESVKLYFAALADRYELSSAEKTEHIEQLKALNEEHLKTIAELVAVLAPTDKQDSVYRIARLEQKIDVLKNLRLDDADALDDVIDQNNQLRFILSILAAVTDDGWIEWHGGECPVGRDVRVDVRFRDGVEAHGGAHWDWKHHDNEADIIAYRIAR